MASFNRVMLMGNLTRDPQLRYLPSQMAVVEFGLAVNRKFRTAQGEDREEVCFVDCSAFGKPAEIINQYCQKGKAIFIEGRLKYDTWEDKQGGGKRSKLSVVVENFQFLGGGRSDAGGAPPMADHMDQTAPPPRQAPRRPQGQGPSAAPPIGQEEHFKEDDIPF